MCRKNRIAFAKLCAVLVVVLAVTCAVAAGVIAPLLNISLSAVLTASMAPALAPGDLLLTRSIPDRQLQIGQIALLTPPGDSVARAHRVTSLTPANGAITVTTRGDANPGPDRESITLSQPTVQIVYASVPWAGYPLLWLLNKFVRATLIGVLGLVITASALRLIVRRAHRVTHR